MIRNTEGSYGSIAKSFHWLMALIILILLCAGFYMTGLSSSPFKFKIYGLHKSFGILVFLLGALRLAWRASNPKPEALDAHARWEIVLAKITHYALYAAVIIMPLSGWLMSSAGDFPANFFGLYELPDLVGKDENLFRITRQIHGVTAYMIIGLLALHISGAFKHHLIDRDATLRRMTFSNLGARATVFLAVAAGGLLLIAAALSLGLGEATETEQSTQAAQTKQSAASDQQTLQETNLPAWTIEKEQSHIRFEATQYGQIFQGAFGNFDGKIFFDPDHPEKSAVDILIDTGSISTGSADRDAQAKLPEWFDANRFPQARFASQSFEKTAANQYVAHGELTIRGAALPIDLPFSLEIGPEKKAVMTANTRLERLDFGIGQGQWQKTDVIGNEVKIHIDLQAHRP